MPSFTFVPRNYVHFDYPLNAASAEKLCNDSIQVARYPFFPFIVYQLITQKIRKRKGGGVEVRARKIRPIAYAAHKDSHIYSHYSALLHERYETELKARGLHRSVTAFRAIDRKNNIHFANEAFEFIRSHGECAVLSTDISDFFGQIRHDKLKSVWCALLGVERLPADHFNVFKGITRYSLVDLERLCALLRIDPDSPRGDGRRRFCDIRDFRTVVRANGLIQENLTGVGIPQGSPISAMLSNLYLLEFDSAVATAVQAAGGFYRRYCDDILVVVPSGSTRTQILQMMRSRLGELGLQAHPEKTELVDFIWNGTRLVTPKPLNYLGFTFDGFYKRIRPGSVARFYLKMRRGVGRIKALRFRASKRARKWLPLRLRQIYLRYSYIGRRNFISYALRAAEIMKDKGIKQQVKNHWKKLQALLGRNTNKDAN